MSEFVPTCELRWKIIYPSAPANKVLQQKWVKHHVEDWREPEEMWIDVPSVVNGSTLTADSASSPSPIAPPP